MPKVEIIKNIGDSLLGFKIIKTEIDKSVQTDYFIILTPFQFQLTFKLWYLSNMDNEDIKKLLIEIETWCKKTKDQMDFIKQITQLIIKNNKD